MKPNWCNAAGEREATREEGNLSRTLRWRFLSSSWVMGRSWLGRTFLADRAAKTKIPEAGIRFVKKCVHCVWSLVWWTLWAPCSGGTHPKWQPFLSRPQLVNTASTHRAGPPAAVGLALGTFVSPAATFFLRSSPSSHPSSSPPFSESTSSIK